MRAILGFFKKEPILVISAAAAAVSCVLVPPDAAYLGYVDLRTLALLYALMLVVAGLRGAGAFTHLAHLVCARAKTARGMGMLLVLMSFFSSMLITNDVALMTFVLITFYKIRAGGVLGYLKGFASPIFVMLPLNILSEIATPLSMAFRMFGNISGGAVITALVYSALASLSKLVHLAFEVGGFGLNIMQLFIPAVLSIYFDLFSGCIQAYIFATLTMVYVSGAAEEE